VGWGLGLGLGRFLGEWKTISTWDILDYDVAIIGNIGDA
jgi:hypothetical protein